MSEAGPEVPDDDCDDPEGETESTQSRHWLTNDAAALALTGTLCLLMLMNLTPWYTVPPNVQSAFVVGFSVASVWLFGKGAAKYIFGGGGR